MGVGTLAAFATLVSPLPGEAEQPSPTALELFTSQGCSACPPADALLAELGKKPGIVALSFAVDYWNYLGWHDTLSRPAHSERQRNYARTRGDGKVYTPQIVVNGLTHVNGANEAAIEMATRNTTASLQHVKVPVSIHADGGTLMIDIGAAPDASDRRDATVWLVIAKKMETVSIKGGENRGKQLSYYNPVRELMPVGMWKGEAMTLKLPLKELKSESGDALIALLQVENAGPILGIAEYGRRN
ncbi:MAG: DUF1223 domain-containing protein [Methyloceanibacter sp.]